MLNLVLLLFLSFLFLFAVECGSLSGALGWNTPCEVLHTTSQLLYLHILVVIEATSVIFESKTPHKAPLSCFMPLSAPLTQINSS